MAEVFRRLFTGERQYPANLLRREGAGAARPRLVGKQLADCLAQSLGFVLKIFQARAPLQPTFPPQTDCLLAQPQFPGNGLVGAPFADRQHDLCALHQAVRDFAAANDGLEKFVLLGRQADRGGRSGH